MVNMWSVAIPPIDPHPNSGLTIDGDYFRVEPETKLIDITSQTEEEKGD